MGEPLSVSRSQNYHWFPTSLLKMRDGSIHLDFSLSPDEYAEDLTRIRGATLISLDEGTTWYFHKYLYLHEGRHPVNIQLDDGAVLRLCAGSGGINVKSSGEAFTWGWRSHDNGRTFEGPFEVPIHFPEEKFPIIPPYFPEGTVTRVVWPIHGRPHVGRTSATFNLDPAIIQLDDGVLLCTASCRFGGDTKSRAVLVRSSDGGLSWSYLATMAYDPDMDRELPPGQHAEGFDEVSLALLPDGELFSVMRTGSGKEMYQSRSSDLGRTWSQPVGTGVIGVLPRLVQMSNGVLACSYGRSLYPPSLRSEVMFSLDGGRTWRDHTTVWYGPSTGYTSMLEVSPGELLYVYDTHGGGASGSWRAPGGGGTGEMMNSIESIKIKVNKT